LSSSYDSLQVQFQRRLRRGLQAMASYTWAHSIDYGSDNRTLPYKRGDSAFDIRHNFSAAATWELPIAPQNAVARAAFSGWSLDGRFTARSAYPVNIDGPEIADPVTGEFVYTGLDLVPGVPLYLNTPSAPGGRMVNPAAFASPANGTGNAPRNFVRGFGATQLDAALHRDIALSDPFRLQLRVEAFNLLNHPNFGAINNTFGNALFGQATNLLATAIGSLSPIYQMGGPRSMQVSLRLVF
jgi:hypothetical protein